MNFNSEQGWVIISIVLSGMKLLIHIIAPVSMIFMSDEVMSENPNDFHKWQSHKWKSLANRIMSDPKIVIHGNECTVLFLTCYFMSWTHTIPIKNIVDRWFCHCR